MTNLINNALNGTSFTLIRMIVLNKHFHFKVQNIS